MTTSKVLPQECLIGHGEDRLLLVGLKAARQPRLTWGAFDQFLLLPATFSPILLIKGFLPDLVNLVYVCLAASVQQLVYILPAGAEQDGGHREDHGIVVGPAPAAKRFPLLKHDDAVARPALDDLHTGRA